MIVRLKPLIRVRFLRGWQTYVKGDVIEPVGTLRSWLLDNEYVEIIKPEPPAVDNDPPTPTPTTKGKAKRKAA